jgi:hypothetical protein
MSKKNTGQQVNPYYIRDGVDGDWLFGRYMSQSGFWSVNLTPGGGEKLAGKRHHNHSGHRK